MVGGGGVASESSPEDLPMGEAGEPEETVRAQADAFMGGFDNDDWMNHEIRFGTPQGGFDLS